MVCEFYFVFLTRMSIQPHKDLGRFRRQVLDTKAVFQELVVQLELHINFALVCILDNTNPYDASIAKHLPVSRPVFSDSVEQVLSKRLVKPQVCWG